MSAKVIPWSYSSLTNFENCPYQYFKVRVEKSVPRMEFKEAAAGTNIHKDVELYCKGEAPLENQSLKQLVDETLHGLDKSCLHFEYQLSVTKDQQATEWDAENCYHRGILDVLYVDDSPVAQIFDWKSGKINLYSQQLKANAITVFAKYPHVETVKTNYVWLKFNQKTPGKVFRDFKEPIWEQFVKRADKLEAALANNVWPKNKTGLCKRYCPVTSCEHNGLREHD